MIQKPITALLIYSMAFSVISQDFHFQRVILCQNNDFQFVQQNPLTDPQLSKDSRLRTDQQILRHFRVQAQPSEATQAPKHSVRCKKWVSSYKLTKKNNLRRSDEFSGQETHGQVRFPLKTIEKRGLVAGDQIQYPDKRQGENQLSQEVGTSYSSNNNQQQVEELMSLYFHYTIMSNVLVYG